jgi:hypothetical protein
MRFKSRGYQKISKTYHFDNLLKIIGSHSYLVLKTAVNDWLGKERDSHSSFIIPEVDFVVFNTNVAVFSSEINFQLFMNMMGIPVIVAEANK